jgi:hypothetical protein
MPESVTLKLDPQGKVPDPFAPNTDTLTLRVGDPPPGKKVDALELVVTDASEKTVYKGVWNKEDPQGTKIAHSGPAYPATLTWKGEAQGGFVGPSGSPFKLKVQADVSDAAPPEEPTDDAPTSDEVQKECPLQQRPPSAVTDLSVAVGSKATQGFTLADVAGGALEVPADDATRRICFAPGKDVPEVRFTLVEVEGIQEATLELLAPWRHGARPVWTHALTKEQLAAGKLVKTDLAGRPFLDDFVTVRRSPLKLKLTIKAKKLEPNKHVAWTYVEAVAAGLLLYYGPAGAIPGGDAGRTRHFPRLHRWLEREKASASTRAMLQAIDGELKSLQRDRPGHAEQVRREEVLLLRGLKKLAAAPRDRSLSQLIDDDAQSGGGLAPLTTDEAKVELNGNVFYRNLAEWARGGAYQYWAAFWGDGPRLPLVAQVLLQDAEGDAVEGAPSALKDLQVLWDWDDPKLDKEAGLVTDAFLKKAFEHEKDDTSETPSSTNCHASLGGKRGKGSPPVFPPQPGTTASAVPAGTFPFRVEPAPKRPWAAISTVYAGDDAAHAGRTGVIFQPSRIAGDMYRVRAYLLQDDAEDFDAATASDDLWKAADQAKRPRAESGAFEVWRRVDLVRFLRKGPDTGGRRAFDGAGVAKRWEPARLRIQVAADATTDANALAYVYGEGRRAFFGEREPTPAGQEMKDRIRDRLADDQSNDGYFARLKPWTALATKAVLDVLDEAAGHSSTDTKRRQRLRAAKEALKADPKAWLRLHEHLPHADRVALSLPPPPPKDATFAKPWGAYKVVKPELVSSATDPSSTINFGALVELLGGARETIKDMVVGALRSYADREHLDEGLFVCSFDTNFPAAVDLTGSASAFPGQPDLRGRRRGFFYVTYPDTTKKLEVHVNDGQLKVGKTNVMAISADLKDGEYKDDHAALLACLAHGAAWAALGAKEVTPDAISAPKRSGQKKDEPDKSPTALPTVADKVVIKVIGEQGPRDDLCQALEAAYAPKVTVVAVPKQDEGHVYVSRAQVLDKARALRLSFKAFSASLDRIDGKKKLYDWLRGAFADCLEPFEVFVHYRDTDDGRHRKEKVEGYLKNLVEVVKARIELKKEDPGGEKVYGITSLTAHELGHCLFLAHAPDTDKSEQWRHVKGFNCLMNYTPEDDPSNDQFCGLCLLAVRGWDIGSSTSPRFAEDGTVNPAGEGGEEAPSEGEATTTTQPHPPEPHVREEEPEPPPPWDGTVGHELLRNTLARAATKVQGCPVWLTEVFRQGGDQGGWNTCGFHSLKNALYLLRACATIEDEQDDDARASQAAIFAARARDLPDAAEAFNKAFLNGGTGAAPGAGSWLKVAKDLGGMAPQVGDSIGTEHQAKILEEVGAGRAELPDGAVLGDAALVAPGVDLGPGDYLRGDGVWIGKIARALRDLHAGAPKLSRGFTVGVGAHYVTVVVHRFKAGNDGFEFLVADSLGGGAPGALAGLSAWLRAPDPLVRKTFDENFYDDLKRRLPTQGNDLERPDAAALSAAQVEDFVRCMRGGVDFLEAAGVLPDGGYADARRVFKAHLTAFRGRLDTLTQGADPDSARVEGLRATLFARIP